MLISHCFVALATCVVLANIDTITAEEPALAAVINECDLTPASGSCVNRQPIDVWTFSKRTQSCQKIFGCYTFGDRNVFRNLVDCRDTCGKPPSVCNAIPRKHHCRRPKGVWTFSKRLGRCHLIVGCYRTRDENVFQHQHVCRDMCEFPIGSMRP